MVRLTVEENTAEDRLLIEVEDNGPGMQPDALKRVFEPFYTTKDVGCGTGLGLSVSYFIVTNNHGGTMEARCDQGRGATFIVRLPLADPLEAQSAA